MLVKCGMGQVKCLIVRLSVSLISICLEIAFFFFFFLRVIYQGLMKTFCSERKNVVFKFSVLSDLGDGQGRW